MTQERLSESGEPVKSKEIAETTRQPEIERQIIKGRDDMTRLPWVVEEHRPKYREGTVIYF